MMALGDRDLVTRLLRQSIMTLCREAVVYRGRLEVDGIICLTVDEDDQHVVKIHEFFDRQKDTQFAHRNSARCTSIEKSRSQDRDVNNSRVFTQTEKQNGNEIETQIKTEPHTDTEGSLEVNHGICDSRSDSPPEMKSNGTNATISLTTVDYKSIGVNKLTISSARDIQCKRCDSVLENVSIFEAHNMTSHGHFTCLICLATFTSRNNMKRHIRLHTGIKPYSCHKCPESFSRNDDYKRHLLKHTFQKPFRCAVCKTGYSDRTCVKSHMIKEHNSKVFHICPQCGESYIDLQKFQVHKKCHPEFQDYGCSVCFFTGSNALMYNKHMLTHGPPKEYKCTHCELTYPDPFTYTNHLKKHKGDDFVQSYMCCFCDTSLPSFEQFQRHEHTHVHSKQHVCSECNKVFRYPSNLREHMLTHFQKSQDMMANNRREKSEYIDLAQDNGHSSRPTTICLYSDIVPQSRHSSMPSAISDKNKTVSNDEMMEIEEENNNHLDVSKVKTENEFGEDPTSKDEVCGGSSEYWCAECNHGFGTENELQRHIRFTHDETSEEIGAVGEESQSFDIHNHLKLKDRPIVTVQCSNDYSMATQLLVNTPSGNESAKCIGGTPERQKATIYSDLVFQPKQIHSVYDENTVVHGRDTFMSTINNSAVDNNRESTSVLNLAQDSLRKIQEIQSRFGIKPVGDSPLYRHQNMSSVTDDEFGVERTKSWTDPDLERRTFVKQTKQPDRSISVSVSGMKMKIQRGPCIPNNNPENSEDTDSSQSQAPLEIFRPGEEQDHKSEVYNHYSKSSVLGMDTEFSVTPSRSSTTTINLKVRNPGFERVVTPEILFKTKSPFTCEVCEETFECFDNFHEHGVKIHRRFICSYCGKVFTSRPNRERHIRYHTGEKPYKCDLCSSSFLRGDDLKYHRTTKHASAKPFTCGSCQTSFSLPKDLEKHLKIYPDHKL